MTQDLKIEYDRGQMIIRLENFLPSPQAKLKKLLKINELDWKNEEQNMQQIIDHCKERLEEENQRKKWSEEKYIKYHQPMLDLQRIVESGKMPSGVPLTKDELKAKKEELRHLKAVVEAAEGTYKKAQRSIKQLEANLQRLQEETK